MPVSVLWLARSRNVPLSDTVRSEVWNPTSTMPIFSL